MYKLIKNSTTQEIDCILKMPEMTFISKHEANKDYQEYLEWLAEGNTPEPAEEV